MLRKHSAIATILVTLPLFLVGWLALRSLRAESHALEARLTAAAMEKVRVAGASLGTALKRVGQEAAARVATTDEPRLQDTLQILHRSGTILLATIHEDERRLFPPEEGVTQFWSEQRVLQTAEPPLAWLRAEIAGDASVEERATTFPYGEDRRYALAYCRRVIARRQVCVVISPDRVAAAIAEARGGGTWEGTETTLVLVTPDGESLFGAPSSGSAALGVLPLGEPLQGWRLEAVRSSASHSPRPLWLSEGAVVIPLLVSWLALAAYFHRVQSERLGAAGRRADLAAQLSHDFRTPLANLRLYSDLVRREAAANDCINGYCTVMEAEIDRLGHLAQTAVTSATGGTADVQLFQAGNPDRLLRAIVGRLEPWLLAAGCVADIEGGADEECLFDLASFERICVNLLDNARKYAADSRITLSTAFVPVPAAPPLLRLSVADQGPGVPEAARTRIFEPMQRGVAGGIDGFGLGLAAVRRLARANGGDAWVENTRPGARFTVTLQTAAGEACPCES